MCKSQYHTSTVLCRDSLRIIAKSYVTRGRYSWSQLGKLKYVHVIVDTYPSLIFCSLSEEAVKDVVTSWLRAFAILGPRKILKTDNGPAYTAKCFQKMWQHYVVTHITGIPYNPQGQSFVGRVDCQFKCCLKIKEGKRLIYLVFYILDFFFKFIPGWSSCCRTFWGSLWNNSGSSSFGEMLCQASRTSGSSNSWESRQCLWFSFPLKVLRNWCECLQDWLYLWKMCKDVQEHLERPEEKRANRVTELSN